MSVQRRLRLMTHPWRLVVTRLPPGTPIAEAAASLGDHGFAALVRSAESLTVVREANERDKALIWRALEIAGPFAFSETGVLAALAQPLAEAGVSIFAVNTYETDFVLVPEMDLDRARDAIARAGHSLG